MKRTHTIATIISCVMLCFTLLFSMGCNKENFTSKGIAEDHFFIKNGTQHMPVSVCGNMDSKKILVILHGGPGGTAIVYRDEFVKKNVENKIAVVYWDQRYAGNSQGKKDQTGLPFFRNDIKNLLTLLKDKYGSDKSFYLMGHSWGGFLAPYFLMEENNQDRVKGWIQVGGAHNYRMNDSLTREMLLFYGNQQLSINNESLEWNEIVTWCQNNGFESRAEAAQLNAFAHRAEGLIDSIAPNSLRLSLRQNALLTQWSNGIASALRNIDEPTYTTPISENLYKIKLPTLLMWGKYDFVCPPDLAKDILTNVGSSDIQNNLYLQSGHSPMANEPQAFWADLLEWIQSH
jgi:pimeloyl-ACP methyl ester carboxylesterase